jgi:hypothetical protein
LATVKVNAHSDSQIEKVEALRTLFSLGKVPSDVNEET